MTENRFDITGKVAFVTGAASGLGQRMAQTLARAGVSVAIADINLPGAQETAAALCAEGLAALACAIDVTDPESIHQAVSQTIHTFKRLDIGVNAAGVAGGRPEDRTPVEIWRRVIDIDLNGVYYCCLEYAEQMKLQHSGKIINIASMSAEVVNHFPHPPVDEARLTGLPAYCAAKAGVRQLTRALAAQLAGSGIRVNSISPGYMATEMTRDIFAMPEVIQTITQETPLRQVGVPADLDGLVLYLASEASDFMTGSDILIDGGYTIW
jgi:NAD(P)-dependent dehydrogenase (short-subunit alcohol dehydrogenase family)